MEIISKSNVSSIIKKKKTIFKIIEEDNAKSIFNTRYNIELICTNFKKCIQGYHFVNTSPINETIWEDINAIIFVSSGINIYSKSDGSHSSGMDIHCSLGRISNKSAKYSNNKTYIDISSYRLTTICNEKNCGTPIDFITEINRRKNFDYYSFI